MKETTVKISVTQDGLLPDEITVLGTIFLPSIQKQLLKSVGFEKIDRGTFAGVMPVKIVMNQKTQVIEFEVGALSDIRKKVIKFINDVSVREFEDIKVEIEEESTKGKVGKSKQRQTKENKTKNKVNVPSKSKLVKKSKKGLKKVIKKVTKKEAGPKKITPKKNKTKSTAKENKFTAKKFPNIRIRPMKSTTKSKRTKRSFAK